MIIKEILEKNRLHKDNATLVLLMIIRLFPSAKLIS